jgi:hypothetical protein
LKLEVAAWVGSGDDRGGGGGEVGQFAGEELGGLLRLGDVIDAGAAAAPGGLRKFRQSEAGDEFEELAGLAADFLAVAKVAGFVIGDGGFATTGRGGAAVDLNQELVDVPDLGIPGVGAGGVGGVTGKEVAVFFEMGTAAAGVGDDGVEFLHGEEIELAAGEGAGGFEVAVVGVEGATAGLHRRCQDFAVIGEEDVGGVAVDVREDEVLDAAGEEGVAVAGMG